MLPSLTKAEEDAMAAMAAMANAEIHDRGTKSTRVALCRQCEAFGEAICDGCRTKFFGLFGKGGSATSRGGPSDPRRQAPAQVAPGHAAQGSMPLQCSNSNVGDPTSCSNVEKHKGQFMTCGQCKSVQYCSQACAYHHAVLTRSHSHAIVQLPCVVGCAPAACPG